MSGGQGAYGEGTPWPAVLGLGSSLLVAGVILLLKGVPTLSVIPIAAFTVILAVTVYKDLIKAKGVGWAESPEPFKAVVGPKVGMWLFLGGEIVMFMSIIGYSLALRLRTPDWPAGGEVLNLTIGAVNTFILITSSMTMAQALASAEAGSQKALRAYLLATIALGLTFLALKFTEYASLLHEGITPTSSLFALTYYAQTGAHGAHVAGGLMGLSYVTVKAFRGAYGHGGSKDVELMGLYWHFVDIVWIFLFVLLYLI